MSLRTIPEIKLDELVLCEAHDCNEISTEIIVVSAGTYDLIELNVCKGCISKFLDDLK